MRYLVKQDLHLLGDKQAGEEEIAVAVNGSIWARVSCTASPAVMRTGHGQRQRNSAAPLLYGFNVLQVPGGKDPGRFVVCHHLRVHHKLRVEPA